jgi:hypothetical protein
MLLKLTFPQLVKKQIKLLEENIIQQLMKSKVTKFHMTAEVNPNHSNISTVQGETDQGCLKLLKSSDHIDYNNFLFLLALTVRVC